MSIWYTLAVFGSFIAIGVAWATTFGLQTGGQEKGSGDTRLISLLAALSLWFITLVWLWIGLVRTAWRWDSDRLGTPIFKYLQIGILVMTGIVAVPRVTSWDELRMLSGMLLAFDLVIGVIAINFLFLAWMARCQVSFHAYWDIVSIIAMIVFQIWLLT